MSVPVIRPKSQRSYQICTCCVMDTTDEDIVFDSSGVCERCKEYKERILPEWNYGRGHEKELQALLDQIKLSGKGKKYDCILGLSGGLDSSYMLHLAVKEWGLHPFVFHIDAGWNLPVAEENIKRLTDKLGVKLHIKKMDWNEMKEMQLAWFRTGLEMLDAPQDHAFISLIDKYSDKLAFLDNLSADMEDGKLSEEMLGNIRGLQNDPVDRAAIGEYVDSMKPLYNDMLETAKQYEEKGEALPEAVQDFMNKMELLGSIAQNRAGSWYLQHYEPEYLKEDGNKNVFNNLPDRVKKMHYNPAGVKYRGGIVAPAFAEGGYVHGGAQLITVAEEGTPEAIIPLGKHRRKRALQLFNQVGGYLEAPGFSPKGFAAGGIVGGSIGSLSGSGGSGMPIAVEVGGVEIKVEAKDGQSLVETIRENKEAISEEIAGVFNAAFKGQFANTPAAGGAGL